MDSLTVQSVRKVSVEDARRLLKRKMQFPKSVENALRHRAEQPTVHELAYMIRQRIANRLGLVVPMRTRYAPIKKITKEHSIKIARNILNGKKPSLNDARLLIGENTRYMNTTLNKMLRQ
jgi:hypothetical protein